MGLKKYSSKRNFKKTSEPKAKSVNTTSKKKRLIFVIQQHHARRLHYDFRLEFNGTLKSWAVPKGPSLDPAEKRLAVEVEDHPIAYAKFEGTIPAGEYGAGKVSIWDRGFWIAPKNTLQGLKKGHIDFELHGTKLKGHWSLIRMGPSSEKNNWLLIKKRDAFAKPSKKKSPPEFIRPQLAQLVEHVPRGSEWLHELKFDGYRTQCRIDNGQVKFLTRSGLDWTSKYKILFDSAQNLGVQNAIIDGELVWLDEKSHSNFQLLQNALSEGRFDRMYFYAFDLLFLNGESLVNRPLIERKAELRQILAQGKKNSRFLYSEHFKYNEKMYSNICRMQLEGVVSKIMDVPYTSGRTPVWRKTKCSLRQEFIIGGYTSSKTHRDFSSLLLGYYEKDKKLRFVGRVGTGFTDSTLKKLFSKMQKLIQKKSAFAINSPTDKNIKWLKPELVAEIEFKTWTSDKILRHASFQGLREDKNVKEITLEKKTGHSILTHPNRVIYPETQTTKKEVFDYYNKISDYLLPYVHDRPIAILRCQETAQNGCYFQKHTNRTNLLGIGSKEVQRGAKKDTALVIETSQDLAMLSQAGTIEIHGWQARFSNIEKPDQIIFDLDPDSEVLWGRMTDTAFEIRDQLKKLGLESFVKITGGKGVHIHVPVNQRYSWDLIKGFSKSLMDILTAQNPDHYTTNMQKSNRGGKIFLDYLRNGYGATAVVPFSLRARNTPSVALPISWKELKTISSPDEYNFREVLKIVKKRKDPWQNYFKISQKITVLEKYPNGEKMYKFSGLTS